MQSKILLRKKKIDRYILLEIYFACSLVSSDVNKSRLMIPANGWNTFLMEYTY